MSEHTNENGIAFDLPKNQSAVIKVIGVGGGGSNAVNHMYHSGIRGVDFLVCNTDAQALQHSPVPNKIQLGLMLTEGLGAGANPEMGERSAEESMEEIAALLEKNTKMVFITAGMGGGTGTGAAPVIAAKAKEMGILTVGIVTMPFEFEGKRRMEQAQLGVDKLRSSVDSLIVINNNKLREVYGNLGFKAGFSKADEVLATAAKGIAEVITHHYTTNIDLRDAKTVLENSGTAIMGSAYAEGPDRATEAIKAALDSPLLNDNQIRGAQNVLLLIVSGTSEEEITIDEIGEINDHIQNEAGGNANIIMGIGEDASLEHGINVTIIATGFSTEQQDKVVQKQPDIVVHTLEERAKSESVQRVAPPVQPRFLDETPQTNESTEKPIRIEFDDNTNTIKELPEDEPEDEPVHFMLLDEEEEVAQAPYSMPGEEDDIETMAAEPTPEPISKTDAPEVKRFALEEETDLERMERFERSMGVKKPLDEYRKAAKESEPADEMTAFKVRTVDAPQQEVSAKVSDQRQAADPLETPIRVALQQTGKNNREHLRRFNYKFSNASGNNEVNHVPAYKRMGVDLDESSSSEANSYGSMTLSGEGKNVEIRTNNSFLHDNVD